FIFLLLQSRSLNLLLMLQETAATLGLNIQVLQKVLIMVISLLTCLLVPLSAAIGFVGFMIPHIVQVLVVSDHVDVLRMSLFVVTDHKKVLWMSLFLVAIFMIWADVVARMIMAPEEIPIGVVTALSGGPFFIWLLRKSSYSFGGEM